MQSATDSTTISSKLETNLTLAKQEAAVCTRKRSHQRGSQNYFVTIKCVLRIMIATTNGETPHLYEQL